MPALQLQLNDAQTVRLVQGALNREAQLLQASLKTTQKHLRHYERKYALSSADFYQRYQRGEMGDDADIMRWAIEFQIFQRLTADCQRLGEVRL